MKVKVIKGRPVYKYKRRLYMDKPDKTYIRKIVYDSKSNVSTVYCRKPNWFLECVCCIIITLCIYTNVSTKWGTELVSFNYNGNPMYYNGNLYLNITVVNCDDDLSVKLYSGNDVVFEDVMSVGECVTTVKVPYSTKYTLEVSTNNIFGNTVTKEYILKTLLKQ